MCYDTTRRRKKDSFSFLQSRNTDVELLTKIVIIFIKIDSRHISLICLWRSQGTHRAASASWKEGPRSLVSARWIMRWLRLKGLLGTQTQGVHAYSSLSCFKALLHSRIATTNQPVQATEAALTIHQLDQLNKCLLFVHSTTDTWSSGQRNPHCLSIMVPYLELL